MTARSYLASALRLLGVLATGESLQEQDAVDALQTFSDMLDAWSAERLTIYAQSRTPQPLVYGTQRYTLGSGGTWNQARPLWIDRAAFLTAAGIESDIDIYPQDQWAGISLKSQTADLPEGIYYNPTFPLGAVDVWPVPHDASVQIVLYAPSASLVSVASLETAISAPPGWAKALRYNLAVELGATYPGTLTDGVAAIARESKAIIKRSNVSQSEMRIDAALLNPRGRWSIGAGDFLD